MITVSEGKFMTMMAGSMGLLWDPGTPKPTTCGTPCPTKSYLLVLPKQVYQWESKRASI